MTRFAPIAAVAIVFVGCGGDARNRTEEPVSREAGAEAPAGVVIVQPADGAEVDAGPLLVVMETTGVEIVAAGNMDSGTGHHHLIVDADVDWSLPIPNDPGVHYHMGQAQTEFTLEDLPPGGHRIIAVVADGVHIPLDPPVSDTVMVIVR